MSAEHVQPEHSAFTGGLTLSSLVAVPVTQVWAAEARQFTPWLLENNRVLSDLLGIEVELDAREHRVGSFALDIIGRETASGRPVIVENQYGTTDHSHLGQLMTYAAGTDPATIVWIAEHFREEHRAALDWLNSHTEPEIRFFGVRLGAVTLAGAPPGLVAPHLELIAKPNDWEKQVRATTAEVSGGPTPTQALYREFWTEMEAPLKQRGWTTGSPPQQNWWQMPTGVGGVAWTLSYAAFGCRSELSFGGPDAETNERRFRVLEARRHELEQAFGAELVFDELPQAKSCRIEARLEGPVITDRARWGQVQTWMLDSQARLRAAVETVGGVPQ